MDTDLPRKQRQASDNLADSTCVQHSIQEMVQHTPAATAPVSGEGEIQSLPQQSQPAPPITMHEEKQFTSEVILVDTEGEQSRAQAAAQCSAASSQCEASVADETQAEPHGAAAAAAAAGQQAPQGAAAATAAALRESLTTTHVKESAHKAAEANASTADDAYHGLFKRVPASWLYLFIKRLPRESREALFATSKWLAKLVLETAAQVMLNLPGLGQLTAQQIEVRRSIITQMLSVRSQFAVTLWSTPWQPFPTQLAARVTSIDAFGRSREKNPVYSIAGCCPWTAMTHLQEVKLIDDGQHTDSIALCDAVEAGHLQQLRNLDMSFCLGLPDAGRFVHTVGPQLKWLLVGPYVYESFLEDVRRLTTLQDLQLYACTVTDDMMQQLCSHPTIRHLTLNSCTVQGDHSQRSCSWRSLTVIEAELNQLLCLPLASSQSVHLLKEVSDSNQSNQHGIENMFAEHLHKITCRPYRPIYRSEYHNRDLKSTFTLVRPCMSMVPLLKRMQGVEVMRLWSAFQGPSVLPHIWQALPSSVCHVDLCWMTRLDWAQVWQGLPQHIARVTIRSDQGMTADDVQSVVRNAPLHVHTMVLTHLHYHHAWEDLSKQLYAAAPKHLHLELSVAR